MNISNENIEKLYAFYDELEELQRQSSDAINAAKEFKDNIVMVARKTGKVQEVTENDLWQEVFHLGQATEGFEVLKGKYPEAFEKSRLHQEKLDELTKFCVAEFGMNPIALRMSDIVRLTDAIVQYRLSERTQLPNPSELTKPPSVNLRNEHHYPA